MPQERRKEGGSGRDLEVLDGHDLLADASDDLKGRHVGAEAGLEMRGDLVADEAALVRFGAGQRRKLSTLQTRRKNTHTHTKRAQVLFK